MKPYIHARLSRQGRAMLEEVKKATGESESELVRRGLHLVQQELGRSRSALALAGSSAGKLKKGPTDLSANPRHLARFGA